MDRLARLAVATGLGLGLAAALAAGSARAQVDVPGNKTSTATLAKGTTRTSVMDFVGDADWFKLTLNDANSYRITTTGPAVIRIYRSNGTQAASSGTKKSYVWKAPANGTYFVAAKQNGAATGSYTLKVTVFDASANVSTESRMTVGKPKSGTMINTGNPDFFGDPVAFPPDEDWLRIPLAAGCYCVTATIKLGTIGFQMLNAAGGPNLREFSGLNGEAGLACNGTPNVAKAVFAAPVSRDYFVKTVAGPAGTTQDTSYTLTVNACAVCTVNTCDYCQLDPGNC
jgi:hypothetical protein